MGRKREETKPQRFLLQRGGVYHYKRRVPKDVADLDDRAPVIRFSLKTSDLAKAMALRDVHEKADNEFWASLVVGDDADVAMRRYKAAVARASALGYTYRSAADLAAYEPTLGVVERIERTLDRSATEAETDSLLGMAAGVDQTISHAVEFYFDTIIPDTLRYKSADQKRRWKNKRRASVATFVEICEDKQMSAITREDAQKVHSFWMNRIAPAKGPATHTASSGNRDMSNLRTLYREWFRYVGVTDIRNPFDGLSFSEKKRRSRPPFSMPWITDRLLARDALAGLNSEARGVLLAMVETGARLSEICNLTAGNIFLDAEHPHIQIEPSFDPEDPREIKTESSIRVVPLVGVSLAAMKAHPHGFERYRDKGPSLSNTVNKYLRTNKLLETPKHVAYSLRHSFEDRMKDGYFDDELRRMLMGHSIDRPKYGSGGSLAWKHGEVSRIALPFDPSIV